MSPFKLPISVVFALVLSNPALGTLQFSPEFSSLIESCKSDSLAEMQWCSGYLNGAVDAVEALKAKGVKSSVCIPADVTNSSMQNAVLIHAKKNPSSLKKRVGDMVLEAFEKAFPCK
jgi:hypothetical protein